MAFGSSLSRLTKSVRRTGEKNNKPQLDRRSSDDSSKTNSSYRKGSNQGDTDSEAASFTSSVNGSTSSSVTSSSTDRYTNSSSGIDQTKTIDKLNSQKVESIRSSRRRPQSRLTGLRYDDPATTHHQFSVEPPPDVQKPVLKFTRSGSLRSLKIVRKKNTSSSESKKSSTVKDTHSKKATFSSTLKDSKFPEQIEPLVGVKESEEVLSAAKLCSYEHCSLHGNHHHHHEPPLKRFSYLKRRSSKDQKSINPQIQPADKQSVKKKQVKVAKKVSNKDVDSSIEFYAKTRFETSFELNCGRDDVHLVDIMFAVNDDDQKQVRNLQMDDQDHSVVKIDVENDSLDGFADVESNNKSGFNNENQMSMWRIIHRYMVSGLIEQRLQEEKQSCCDDDDAVDDHQGKEAQKMFAIKIVRKAIEKILFPEEIQGNDQTEIKQAANNLFITELEKAKKKLDSEKRAGHAALVPGPEQEAEVVSLRSQTSGDKKNSNEWMLDYALQQVVAELGPTQKRKVALLVKSFEMITPKLDKGAAI